MDAVYPEPLFRQNRRAVRKKVHRGPASRYRTQPVTFAEIQEVDEENAEEQPNIEREAAKSERDLHARFQEFWRNSKHGDIGSTPTHYSMSPASESPLPLPSPPSLQISTPCCNLSETSPKSSSSPQANCLSPPIHILSDRSSPSRTSI